jgi:hypothetical protein
MNQFPPSPRVFHLDRFEFFRKFSEIFASQGAPPVLATPAAKLPPVSTTPVANLPLVLATPVANFSTIFASVVDTGGKFAAGVNDTGGKFSTGVNDAGGKLPPVSTTPAANLPPVSLTLYSKTVWQCRGSRSGIRCRFDPWIRDPGSGISFFRIPYPYF